ncbi:hypothetical protein [Burkholderia pseudomallei]|uniref:hypothetical protein n=1 Tax=Burkholderia pseudomallei TaxID=28450 RepID=UPI001EFB5367|nr:hypothetical protein [Burkholderia pseudomallei]
MRTDLQAARIALHERLRVRVEERAARAGQHAGIVRLRDGHGNVVERLARPHGDRERRGLLGGRGARRIRSRIGGARAGQREHGERDGAPRARQAIKDRRRRKESRRHRHGRRGMTRPGFAFGFRQNRTANKKASRETRRFRVVYAS